MYSSELVELWHKLFMIHRRKKVLDKLEAKTGGSNKRVDEQRRQLTVKDFFLISYAIIPLWCVCSRINFSVSPFSDR